MQSSVPNNNLTVVGTVPGTVDENGVWTPSPGGGGSAATIADGADVAQGTKADVRATWYDSAASVVSLLKLSIAAAVDAGSHVYGYNGTGQLTSDAWTLLGTTRTKTFTYTASVLTAESDWV